MSWSCSLDSTVFFFLVVGTFIRLILIGRPFCLFFTYFYLSGSLWTLCGSLYGSVYYPQGLSLLFSFSVFLIKLFITGVWGVKTTLCYMSWFFELFEASPFWVSLCVSLCTIILSFLFHRTFVVLFLLSSVCSL